MFSFLKLEILQTKLSTFDNLEIQQNFRVVIEKRFKKHKNPKTKKNENFYKIKSERVLQQYSTAIFDFDYAKLALNANGFGLGEGGDFHHKC